MTEEENKAMQMEYSQKLTTTGTISLVRKRNGNRPVERRTRYYIL